jgi:hypothetical protein
MLAVAVLHQLDRSFSAASAGSGAAFDIAVRQRCDAVTEPAFRDLLLGMLDCQEPIIDSTEIDKSASGAATATSASDAVFVSPPSA